MINTPTTLDPREMTDDLRHTGDLSMLYRCAIAVAFIAALDRADKAEARGYARGLRDAATIVGNAASSFPDDVAWCVEDLTKTILACIPATPTKT